MKSEMTEKELADAAVESMVILRDIQTRYPLDQALGTACLLMVAKIAACGRLDKTTFLTWANQSLEDAFATYDAQIVEILRKHGN